MAGRDFSDVIAGVRSMIARDGGKTDYEGIVTSYPNLPVAVTNALRREFKFALEKGENGVLRHVVKERE